MYINPAKITLAALALVGSVQAHTRPTTLFVDGHNQGDGVCVRMDMNGSTTNSPIAGIQSPQMACGRDGEIGVARVCPAKAGSTLTFEFRESPDGAKPGSINPSHKGPCSVFMKKVDSAIASNNAAGDGWFKIWDEGYDEAAGKWCTSKMVENNGHLSVTVPSDIEGGYYLVRPELLALHAATANPPDPQFYVGCMQIYLDSTGTAKPATISIPDNYVDISMPGMTFDIYSTPLALPYPMYGPKAYEAGGSQASPSPSVSASASPASSSGAAAYSSAPAYGEASDNTGDNSDEECDATEGNDTTADAGAASISSSAAGSSATPVVTNNQSPVNGQSEGLKPEGCILENANWCGFEVKSYTDENGCWSSSADCWKQSQDCFDKTPPTGYKNCDIWADKCNHLDDTCKAKQFTGPPDAGKDLTPPREDLSTTASRKLMALVRKHESHVMKGANRLRHE